MSSYQSNIWKMYVYKFLGSMHFIGGVLVPFFLEWGQISFTQLMILQSFFVFSVFLLEIPTGAVADYLGRKTSLILAALATGTGAFIYSLYPNFLLFFVGEFFWAIGTALVSGADEALVYDSLKKVKQEKTSKKIFGRFNSFHMAALMIAGPIGSIIASTFGLRYTMMLIAVPMFFAFLLAFSFKEPKIMKKGKSKSYLKTIVSGIRYFKQHKELKILAFNKISIGALLFFIVWTYQPLLTQLNFPLIYFGFVHAAVTGIQIPFLNNFERLEKIFGSKRNYLLWSALIPGIGFILLGLNSYVPVTILLIIIVAGFGLSRYVLFQSYMNKFIESENRATVVSTVSMIDKLFRAILYPIVGLLVEWSLNYAVIIIGGAIVFFGLVSKVQERHLID